MAVSAPLIAVLGALALSSELVASDVIKAGEPITMRNVTTETGAPLSADNELVGREVVRTVYAGQAVSAGNTRAPLVVRRNQVVTLKYVKGALEITTSGRAMASAGANEQVTVLNTTSRQLVSGVVLQDGSVLAQ